MALSWFNYRLYEMLMSAILLVYRIGQKKPGPLYFPKLIQTNYELMLRIK